MAVYTEVSDTDLTAFMGAFDLGAVLSFKGIAEGVENSNFYLRTERGSYFLTLYEKRVREEDLPFFLGLLEHLSAKGIQCPLPVRARDGRAWRELNGRPAAIVTYLSGLVAAQAGCEPMRRVGRGAWRGCISRARTTNSSRPNALSIEGWKPLVRACDAKANSVRMGLAR